MIQLGGNLLDLMGVESFLNAVLEYENDMRQEVKRLLRWMYGSSR